MFSEDASIPTSTYELQRWWSEQVYFNSKPTVVSLWTVDRPVMLLSSRQLLVGFTSEQLRNNKVLTTHMWGRVTVAEPLSFKWKIIQKPISDGDANILRVYLVDIYPSRGNYPNSFSAQRKMHSFASIVEVDSDIAFNNNFS